MKTVKDLMDILKDLPEDFPIAFQRNEEGGYFSMHKLQIMPKGHIGFSGCIFSCGEPVKYESEKGN